VEGEGDGSLLLPARPRFASRVRSAIERHLDSSGSAHANAPPPSNPSRRIPVALERHHVTHEAPGPAHSHATHSNVIFRHPPPSRSPVRDSETAHARWIAGARLLGRRRDNESRFSRLPRMEFVSYPGLRRRGQPLGDYMRDEDFDSSYENLLSLSTALGEAKSRAVPEQVITSLPTGFYKDWATTGSDQRCPICLDDYKPLDRVLKLTDCSHWLHQGCLEQWLRGASTCPICRNAVKGNRGQDDENEEDSGPSGSGHGSESDDGVDSTWDSMPPPPWY